MDSTNKITQLLLEIKAVTLRTNPPYTWVSGIKAPIYCDNRLIMSYPDKRQQVRDAFMALIKEHDLEFDVIAGVATSGIPHAAWLAETLNKPMIYVRSKSKGYGKENLIEGKLEPGQKVLVIEDLISTGGSVLTVINAIREAGGKVNNCLAIFTYEMEKAENNFKEGQVKLITLSNFSSLVKTASETGYLAPEEKEKVLEWNKNPEEWNN